MLNARGTLRVGSHARLSLGVENLTDADYRVHGSGTNEPGRSLVVGLDTGF